MNRGVKYIIIFLVIVLIAVVAYFLFINKPTDPTIGNQTTTSTLSTSSLGTDNTLDESNSIETVLNLNDSTYNLPTVALSTQTLATIPAIGSSLSNSSSSSASTSESTISSVSTSSASSSTSNNPAQPQNVLITNKDYKRWTVTWTTKIATAGSIEKGITPTQLSIVLNDDRDQSGQTKFFTHHVTVVNDDSVLNANPTQTFYFQIVSDGNRFSNNGSPYTYKNAALLSSPPSPTQGIIVGSPVLSKSDYIVIGKLSGSDAQISSTVVSGSSVTLPVGIFRNSALTSYISTTSGQTLSVSIYGKDGKLVGTKSGISLANIDDATVTVTINENGITPNTSSSSTSSAVVTSSSSTTTTSRSSTTTVSANTTSSSITTTSSSTISDEEITSSSTSSVDEVPATGIAEDFTLIVIAIIIFGLGFILIRSRRRSSEIEFQQRILSEMEKKNR